MGKTAAKRLISKWRGSAQALRDNSTYDGINEAQALVYDERANELENVLMQVQNNNSSNKIGFAIKKVTVVQDRGPDTIVIDLDGPSTMPNVQKELFFKTEAQKGSGPQWVRDNLGVEPEVIVVPSPERS